MYTSTTLASAAAQWQAAADRLLTEAERVGPLDPGPTWRVHHANAATPMPFGVLSRT